MKIVAETNFMKLHETDGSAHFNFYKLLSTMTDKIATKLLNYCL